ncbi:MAG: SGNH/GDSL hydrolase family protein [Oscillospiraceae bacterium]|nr:SGNH/GDSL hydrolase family protein [Oscillospiraceae bacterium]
MKNILCYGDSNTWGWIPGKPECRFPYDVRWTGLLQKKLGDEYRVIEAGLNGRTTVWEDPVTPNRNGKATLGATLEMQRPFDLVIIMLGTNDTKIRFSATVRDITNGLAEIVKGVRNYPYGADPIPEILILAPLPIREGVMDWPMGETFDVSAMEKSRKLAEYYAVLAKDMGCHFADASAWGQTSDLEGVHMTAETHASFAEGVYAEVKKILG